VLYVEPSAEVWSKVKVEKSKRSKFRPKLKDKKDAEKEQVESMAFKDKKAHI
jgi:hypothetical protein